MSVFSSINIVLYIALYAFYVWVIRRMELQRAIMQLRIANLEDSVNTLKMQGEDVTKYSRYNNVLTNALSQPISEDVWNKILSAIIKDIRGTVPWVKLYFADKEVETHLLTNNSVKIMKNLVTRTPKYKKREVSSIEVYSE